MTTTAVVRAARAVQAAALDAALAGVVVGLADAALIVARAPFAVIDAPGTAAVAIGLAVLAATVLGVPAVLGLRLLGGHPLLRPLAARLRQPGAPRVEAVAALALAGIALAVIWYVGYRAIAFGHVRYRVAGAAGLLGATELVALMIVVTLAATAGGPAAVRWLGRRRLLQRATTGRAGVVVAGSVALGAGLAIDAVLGAVAPAFDARPAYVLVSAPLALLVAAVVAPSRRLRERGARLAGATGGALVVVALLALLVVGRVDPARGALVRHGTVSQLTLRALHALTDDDGDGFSDRLGGGDCDDGEPRVHPGAASLAGNGVDDNCAGGDGSGEGLAHRRAGQPSATPGTRRRDIVLVTMDSVRADHSSAYGHPRATTPALAALATRGARFTRAISPAPMTVWALPALLFGRYASTLPYRDIASGPAQLLAHQLPTLASTLADAGYTTHALLANDGIRMDNAQAGFADVESLSHDRLPEHRDNSDAVTDRALAWLAAQPADRPCLLWVHYFDPHYPYAPRAEAPRFGGDDAYDRGIAFTDAQLGRLVDGLRASRGEDVIVAVTADHGEALGEHGTRFHGKSLYQEQVEVPLVIVVPGAAPQTIAPPVSLVDLAPTLLDLVGLTAPAGMNGWSLAAAVRGSGPVPAHDVLSELFRGTRAPFNLRALYRGSQVVIRDLDSSTVERYDLATDPAQRHALGDDAQAAALVRALDVAVDRELGVLTE